jgi:hypothetical protein
MKNKSIDKIVNEHHDLRHFIWNMVNEVFYEGDRDHVLDYNNSNLVVRFDDFDITIDDFCSVQIKNERRYFYKSDFENFESLNNRIMAYEN